MDAAASPRRAKHPRLVLAVAAIASFLVSLDLLVVTTALEVIRRDLDLAASTLQWTVTAYGVTFAALLMAGAALGNRYGRRRMLVVGLAIFAAGSAAAALSGGFGGLIAARVLQGVGGALVLPLGLAVVSAANPPDRRGGAIGALEGISGLAVVLGPLVGGVIADELSWRWIFWVNVPLALLAIPATLAVVEESRSEERAVDGRGTVLLGLATGGAVWALARGNDVGWATLEVAVTAAVAVVAGVAFARWQRRAPHPLLPPRLLRIRAVAAGAAAATALSAALYGAVYFVAQLLQVSMGHDPTAAGLRLVPWTATLLVVAPLAGVLADRRGARPVLLGGLAVAAVGLAWLAASAGPGVGYTTLLPPLLVAGLGLSAAIPVSQSAIVAAVDEEDLGTASGTVNTLQEVGGGIGVAVAVALFLGAGGETSVASFSDGFSAALAGCAVLAAVGAACALALPRAQRTGRSESGVSEATVG